MLKNGQTYFNKSVYIMHEKVNNFKKSETSFFALTLNPFLPHFPFAFTWLGPTIEAPEWCVNNL